MVVDSMHVHLAPQINCWAVNENNICEFPFGAGAYTVTILAERRRRIRSALRAASLAIKGEAE